MPGEGELAQGLFSHLLPMSNYRLTHCVGSSVMSSGDCRVTWTVSHVKADDCEPVGTVDVDISGFP